MKKNIAIFLTGGIGAGNFSQGFPKIVEIINELKVFYSINVYSFSTPDKGFIPRGFKIYSPPRWLKFGGLRWPFLILLFLKNHLFRAHHVLFSFWGYQMSMITVILSKMTRKPSIVCILGAEAAFVPAINYGNLIKDRSRKQLIWTCGNASSLVVLTASQKEKLEKFGLKRSAISQVPFGAKKDLFQFNLKVFKQPLNIIHIANLTEVKDQTTLIKAFALLRKEIDSTLRIVGSDHLKGKIQLLAKQMQLENNVEFTGPLPYEKIPGQFEWADICILTSLSEGQNNSLTEAAMCGVLQVSTPVGHIKDIGESIAVVVNIADPIDMVEKIKSISKNEAAWNDKIRNARNWAEKHDLNYTITRLKDIIDNATFA